MKYPDGNSHLVFDYPRQDDLTFFKKMLYFPNGKIRQKTMVKQGRFVDSMTTYFANGNIYQVDSLLEPCDTLTRACDAIRRIYYENGKIATYLTMKGGHYYGISRHFDGNGLLVKEYPLIRDSIKDGEYKEFDLQGNVNYKEFYKNDTLVGFTYFFGKNGDTLKYYNHYKGIISLPYKKWIGGGNALFIDYQNEKSKVTVWKWIDKKGFVYKKKLVIPKNHEIIIPK
jgi:antitoxin component YwqK of YwqJK toxin-antitoxin module